MQNPLLPLMVRAQIAIDSKRQRLRSRMGDQGAGLIEYGALIVLALAILGAIWATGFDKTITDETKKAMKKLFTPKDPGGE